MEPAIVRSEPVNAQMTPEGVSAFMLLTKVDFDAPVYRLFLSFGFCVFW
jgi:hypothetical protein